MAAKKKTTAKRPASKKKKKVAKKKATNKKSTAKAKKKKTAGAANGDKPKGKGGAPKGNQFWKARSSHGRNPIFKNSEELWGACVEYFEWIEDNPLTAAELVKYQGEANLTYVPKMRAMTVEGLCLFLDIGYQTWRDYAGREDFSEVVTRAEAVIREQKFTGAAAEMLNPNIIARDLGLRDKQDHQHTGPGGGPIQHEDITDAELKKELARLGFGKEEPSQLSSKRVQE